MEVKMNILLVEDDYNLGIVTKRRLEEAGYDVVHASDGESGYKTFIKTHFDICLIDIVMPKMNGYDLAKKIRDRSDIIPILFLSSKSQDEDKILGFRSGGDDYITKPFSMQELILRIEVFLKRSRPLAANKEAVYVIGNYTFYYLELVTVTPEGRKEVITAREADLLKFYCENANKIIKREEILYNVWGKDDYFLGRSLDVFNTKIRKRFRNDSRIQLETIHGVGLKFQIP